jgi:hypothetical protein
MVAEREQGKQPTWRSTSLMEKDKGSESRGDRWCTFMSRRVLDTSCKARLVKTKTVHSAGSEALGSMHSLQETECDARI